MIRLFGRTLQRPTLLFKQKQTLGMGSWNLDGKAFRKPMALINWACLKIQTPRDQASIHDEPCRSLLNKFVSHLKLKGITGVNDEKLHGDLPIVHSRDYESLDKWFKECPQDFGVTFLIVVLPDHASPELYNHIKRYGDVKHGVHTVCVKSQKFGKVPYDENVALVSAGTFLF